MNEKPPLEVRWVKAPEPEAPDDRELIERTVREIIGAVRERGDAAVREYSARLDHWNPQRFRVGREEIERAHATVGQRGVDDIAFLRDQVRAFAEAQMASLSPVGSHRLAGPSGSSLQPVPRYGFPPRRPVLPGLRREMTCTRHGAWRWSAYSCTGAALRRLPQLLPGKLT